MHRILHVKIKNISFVQLGKLDIYVLKGRVQLLRRSEKIADSIAERSCVKCQLEPIKRCIYISVCSYGSRRLVTSFHTL